MQYPKFGVDIHSKRKEGSFTSDDFSKNKIAKALNAIGWAIIALGALGSFILGGVFSIETKYSIDNSYNWWVVIAGFCSSIISGIIFIGFAEIINLLQYKADILLDIDKRVWTIEDSVYSAEKPVDEKLPNL